MQENTDPAAGDVGLPIKAAKDGHPGATMVKTFEARKQPRTSPWNSLEVVKIFVGALTPLLIAGVGVFATVTLHREDERRQLRDDMRARKAAALPLILDLKEATADLIQKSDSFRQGMYFYKYGTSAVQDGLAALEESHAMLSSFSRKEAEDWARLEPIVDDRELYRDLYGTYNHRVVGLYMPQLQECANAAVVPSHLSQLRPAELLDLMRQCPSREINRHITECTDYLMRRLANFDMAENEFENVNSVCPLIGQASDPAR
jgi:hypothetical protein